jgi:hypothetical protein
VLLQHIEQDRDILLESYPEKNKRFDQIRLDNLLRPEDEELAEIRSQYFDGLADILYK